MGEIAAIVAAAAVAENSSKRSGVPTFSEVTNNAATAAFAKSTGSRTIIIEHQPQVIPETVRMRIGDRTYTMDEMAAIVAQYVEDEEAADAEAGTTDVDPPDRIRIGTDTDNHVRVNGVVVPRLRFGTEGVMISLWGKEYVVLDGRVRVPRDAHSHEWLWFLAQALTTQP